MCAHLIQVAVEEVKALAVGNAGGIRLTKSPFADQSGVISRILQNFSDSNILGNNGCSLFPDTGVPHVIAGHQTAA